MNVLILAGGYGTRLYPLVKDTAKPLLHINDKPLINYILDRIQGCEGLSKVLVVTNDKFFNDFQHWAESQSDSFDIKVFNDGTTSNDDRLGSIGDIDFVIKQEPMDDDLLVVGGDNIFEFNLTDFSTFAKKNSPHVTIGAFDIGNIDDAHQYGVLELDAQGKIISFEEKPQKPRSSLISMCFYYLPKESQKLLGEYLEKTKNSDKAGDYIRWLSQKHNVYGFKFEGKWFDIRSVESYQEAQERFK